MSSCRSCGAEIDWVQTDKGKWMPIDPGDIEPGDCSPTDVIVNEDGHVCQAKNANGGVWHISHFATCPNADEYRR